MKYLQCLFELSFITNALFTAPYIEVHPEVIQITPYFIKLECNPLFLKEFQVGIAVFDIGILIFSRNRNCDVFNIFPVIAILRQIKIQTQMLTVSRLQTLA